MTTIINYIKTATMIKILLLIIISKCILTIKISPVMVSIHQNSYFKKLLNLSNSQALTTEFLTLHEHLYNILANKTQNLRAESKTMKRVYMHNQNEVDIYLFI